MAEQGLEPGVPDSPIQVLLPPQKQVLELGQALGLKFGFGSLDCGEVSVRSSE